MIIQQLLLAFFILITIGFVSDIVRFIKNKNK
jgi:hypothetical protein